MHYSHRERCIFDSKRKIEETNRPIDDRKLNTCNQRIFKGFYLKDKKMSSRKKILVLKQKNM